MRRLLVLLAAFGALAIGGTAAAPAAAAAPASLSGTIALEGAPDPIVYGDTITFSTTVVGKAKPGAQLYVRVVCSQRWPEGGWPLVYQASSFDLPSPSFTLVDLAGDGLDWRPELGYLTWCSADLVHRVDKPRGATITPLATVDFKV